ncbi:MAG: nucleotide exchange factor GrpE [Phycisphaerae bacterium]|nr:nucleotide exchange factor GrpE [Phycisphaerae bacterium]
MSDKDTKKASKEIKLLEKKVEELESQLKELAAEKQTVFEQLQRVSADYANYQKRAPKQIADSVAYEKKAILRSLLPSVDNFEHALSHASAATGEEAVDNLVKGIQLAFDHMLDALKMHGVKRIEAMGQSFDPNLHEAMMRRSEPDKEDNTVLEVYQAGYMMGEQVLRPSKVIVNMIEQEQPAQQQAPKDVDETTDTEPEV